MDAEAVTLGRLTTYTPNKWGGRAPFVVIKATNVVDPPVGLLLCEAEVRAVIQRGINVHIVSDSLSREGV